MLNEEQLEFLPEGIAQRLEKVNQHYLEMVGARIKEIGSMSATDIHRLEIMKSVGADVDKITAELVAISGKNAAEIKEIFDIVANDSVSFSEQFLGSGYNSTALKQYVAALAAQSVGDYVNMSQNTAFMVYQSGKKVLTSLSKAYSDVIDDAIVAVTTGQTDFYSAMRGSLKNLADSGIRTKYSPLKGSAGKAVDYASGYSRRLDTAVRQNLLWGVKQCNQGIQEQVGEFFGADGWEIDYHSNPRPTHAAMGGIQYAAGNTGQTVDGVYYPPFSQVEDLLNDYGCLHRKWPIILGISEPNHNAEELAKLKAEDEKIIEFEGQEYTKYELSQIQRKLETAARHAKDRQIIAKAAGDDELRRHEQAKINLITSKYAKISKAAGLPTRTERLSVSKYRKVKTLEELDPNLTFVKNQFKIIRAKESPKKLELPDERIKATSDVDFPKIKGVVPKGSAATNVYVMAGDGTSTPIKDLKRLYAEYPEAGIPQDWQKKSADVYTDNFKYVVHWYENKGIVPVGEIKTKGVKKI